MLRAVLGRYLLSASAIALFVACSYDWDVGKAPTSDAGDSSIGGSRDAASGDARGAETVPGGADAGPTSGACGASCACSGSQSCNFECPSGKCTVTCSGSSTCNIACANKANCTVVCEDSAKCNMDCSAGGASCAMDCNDSAQCTGSCQKGSLCFKRCDQKCDGVKCTSGGVCL